MAGRVKSEQGAHQKKLTSSYQALLDEFSSTTLSTVGTYTLSHLLATGSYGKVYLARHQLTNGTKVVLKSTARSDSNLAREIHHHRQFVHPHIARLYEVVVTEEQVWLALEFCPGDELYNYLVKHGGGKGLEVSLVQKIFTQLVGAVSYIHSKNCVHRDLKLENVLLDKKGDVKVVDFGFTREYEGKANYLSTFCGTVCYSAPEMLKGEKYAGEKVDVWSLGIILYALLTGRLPWDEDDDMLTKQKILKEDPVFPEAFNEQAKTLVQKLLSKRPLYRPSLAEILNDPFLSDFAPHQQAILKLSQPAPFTTPLEKTTLERMKAAGVDIDKVIENVLAQRCDTLAGWWNLLIEKEQRKEIKRERKRKEKEAELKMLRRLSGASSRLERIAPMLEDVAEEAGTTVVTVDGTRSRSISRGRQNRRSTPQILVSDLPRLPEGSAVESPGRSTPPAPVDKDSASHRTSRSTSRPPPPPKEPLNNRRRRSSNLQLTINASDLAPNPPHTIPKRRFGRGPGPRSNGLKSQLTAFKHWFVESTKRAAAPTIATKNNNHNNTQISTATTTTSDLDAKERPGAFPAQTQITTHKHAHTASTNTYDSGRNSYGATLTPTASHASHNYRVPPSRLDMQRTRARGHSGSISPSPITPRSSFRRHHSAGLHGRKSTSSSVSSIRSLHHYTTNHSKASSVSSDNDGNSSMLQSPGTRSQGRSPHASTKVLPATPTAHAFPSNIRFARTGPASQALHLGLLEESAPIATSHLTNGSPGVMFAKRRKSPFKGLPLSSTALQNNTAAAFEGPGYGNLGSPAVFGGGSDQRSRAASATQFNVGLRDIVGGRRAKATQRKSMVITEEDEEEEEEDGVSEHPSVAQAMASIGLDEPGDVIDDDDEYEESVEEVDHFSPVHLNHGESVHSIMFFDDPILTDEATKDLNMQAPSTGGLRSAFHTQPSTPAYEMDRQLGELGSPADTIRHDQYFDQATPTPGAQLNFESSTQGLAQETPIRQSSDTNKTADTTTTSGTVQRTPLKEKTDSQANASFPIIPTRTSSGQLKNGSYYAAAIAHEQPG